MDNKELTAHIVRHLSEADDVDDVIFAVCQTTGYDWATAKALVAQVQQDQEAEIAKRQFPLLFVIALLVFLGGLLLFGYGTYVFIQNEPMPKDIPTYLMPIIEKRVEPAAGIQPAIRSYFHLFFNNLYNPIAAMLFGGAMIYGSLVGMKQVWSSLLNRH